MFTKTGSAKWYGSLKDGHGEVSTQSGAVSSEPYSFAMRFADQPGTNPEELFGAAYAACFSMAFASALGDAGVSNVKIDTTCAVMLDRGGAGFSISKVALTTSVSGNGDHATIEQAAEGARSGCPGSKLLNSEVTLDLIII